MGTALRVVVALVLLGLFSPTSWADAPLVPPSTSLDRVKEALIWSLCYRTYWWYGGEYRQGTPLPLELKIEGNQFFAWIEGTEVYKGDRISHFFLGRVKENTVRVILVEGYNVDLTPPVPGYLERRRYFQTGPIIKDTLIIPTDCTPRYDPPTPQKERMLQTLVSSMQKKLSEYVRLGIAEYPRELTLIIANFNVDYPWTYVLTEPPTKLYIVTLAEGEDEYLFKDIPIKPHVKPLLAKIRKHGILRKIVLTP